MACPLLSTLVILLFISLLIHYSVVSISDVSNVRSSVFLPSPADGSRRTTMLLPLFPPKNTSRRDEISRQHLLNISPANARMSLHDDLLLNGYYTTHIWIGTPPHKFALIVDTGSTVTYVPCSSCKKCGNHQDPKFQPKMSSTYQSVKCDKTCPCDLKRQQCIYERRYAEMSSSFGLLGEDVISFGNPSDLGPQRAVFGCEIAETGDLYSQRDVSIVDQLVGKHVISDSFSLCFGGMDFGGGAMVLGGIRTPAHMVFTKSDFGRSPYYNIELKEIHVAGKPLKINPRFFGGKHGTILDSGTTYAYLPEAAFVAFKSAVMKELHSLKQIKGPDPSFEDICFSGAASDVSQLSKNFPPVDMVFGDGNKLTLSPENYLFQHFKVHGAYCLGIFLNGKNPTSLLGGIVVRNTLVTYDRENARIGFWKTNCSELWGRLNSPPPSPAPSPPTPAFSGLDNSNSTTHVSPSPAPSEPPEYDIPGEVKIGLIKFYLSLSVNFAELKPRIPELAHVIAQELDINVSQVRLMNFSMKGNDSLTKWAIFPVGYTDYMPNATAMEIIGRLAEHHPLLQDSFGSYKLFDWGIEPPQKRKLWLRNSLVLLVPVLVVLIVGLSAPVGWFIWRRRQESAIPYEPVGGVETVTREQETAAAKMKGIICLRWFIVKGNF
ncbi:unnamed protein product [Withania somnifera]